MGKWELEAPELSLTLPSRYVQSWSGPDDFASSRSLSRSVSVSVYLYPYLCVIFILERLGSFSLPRPQTSLTILPHVLWFLSCLLYTAGQSEHLKCRSNHIIPLLLTLQSHSIAFGIKAKLLHIIYNLTHRLAPTSAHTLVTIFSLF